MFVPKDDSLITKAAGNMRARRIFKLKDRCDMCSEKAMDRHHIDGNPINNNSQNILFLCRKCHMAIDGRLELLPARYKHQIKLPEPCINCGTPSKPLRKGLCHSCNEYLRRTNKRRPMFAPNSRSVTVPMENLVLSLRKKKVAYRKIAAIVGISATNVLGICHRNGVEIKKGPCTSGP